MSNGLTRRSLLTGLAAAFVAPAEMLKPPEPYMVVIAVAPAEAMCSYARVAVCSSLSNWAGSTDPLALARGERKYHARMRYTRRYERQRLGDQWKRILEQTRWA